MAWSSLNYINKFYQAGSVRPLGYRTGQAYVDWVIRFNIFNDKRHAEEMGET